MGFLDRLLGRGGDVPERPSTSNGSSAWHLWWHGTDGGASPVVAASVTLEVLQQPTVDDLYFWALQATFADGRRTYGSAHTGLQWNARHPGRRAVNWGGYGDVGDVQSVLPGSTSPLPSSPDDPNTRDYAWADASPYRFTISRGVEGWRATVADLRTGDAAVIRELYVGGDRLAGFVVWSEVFCSCHDPTVVVRWSDFAAERADGAVLRPTSVGCTFPREGCPNTDSVADEVGILQVSHTPRRARDGESIPLAAR